MKKYYAEFIGTYALVFAGTGAIIVNDLSNGAITHLGVAITFGLIVMTVIYSIGDVSGAHINPAVTIAFAVAKRLDYKEVMPYVLWQCAGALLASGTLRVLFPVHSTLGATLPAGSWHQAFLLELLLTFFLMFVILRVSTGAKEKGIVAGIVIGAVVALEAIFAGPICGASMNPARSLGPALVAGNSTHLWVYLVAPTIGAVLGSLAYQIIREPSTDDV